MGNGIVGVVPELAIVGGNPMIGGDGGKRESTESSGKSRRKALSKKRDEYAENEIKQELPEDLLLLSRSLALMAEHNKQDFEHTEEIRLESEKRELISDAAAIGMILAEIDIEAANKKTNKEAKYIIDNSRRDSEKAQVAAGVTIQKAKIEIGKQTGI